MTAHRKPNGTRAVRGSKSGRPIMALLDLLGRRWTLRIIWELRNGPLTSRALRQACDAARHDLEQSEAWNRPKNNGMGTAGGMDGNP